MLSAIHIGFIYLFSTHSAHTGITVGGGYRKRTNMKVAGANENLDYSTPTQTYTAASNTATSKMSYTLRKQPKINRKHNDNS